MSVVLIVFLGFVCAVGVGLVVNMLTPKEHRVRPRTLWGILVALVLLSTAVGFWQHTVDDASGTTEGPVATSAPHTPPVSTPSDEPTLTPTPTVDDSTDPPSTPTTPDPTESSPETEPPPTTEPTATPKSPATQYLADLKPLYGDPGEGPATIGGNKIDCGRSVRFPINGFQGQYTAEYRIDKTAAVFRATLGIDNATKPGAKIHFLIYLDDVLVNDGYLLTYYDTQEFKVSVKGKSVLKLFTEVVASGGVGNTGRSVWGNARFTVV
jgi:hypothetical protein